MLYVLCCTVLPHLMTFEAADQALVSTPPDQPAAVVTEGRSEVSLSLETKQNLILLSGVLLICLCCCLLVFDVDVDVGGLGSLGLGQAVGGTVCDILIITLAVDPPHTVLTFQSIPLKNTHHQFLGKKIFPMDLKKITPALT